MPDMDPPGNADGTCKYVQVNDGDDCWSIAKNRCKIEPAQLYKFNGGSDAFCNKLQPKQPLCCTKGKLPDLRPKKNADGSCFVYSVGKDEVCDSIAEAHFLETDDIKKFNVGKTWGFAGCNRLMRDQRICLSDGTPPFPVEIPDAQCGPQKPGTKPPKDTANIANMNPCPLNVCCNTWGFCGTTPEFCTDTSVDKTPGTAMNNTNGCISNCGLDIVNNDKSPKSFGKIAYYEGWNTYTRGCLHMDVTEVTKTGQGYTHVHFAFANLTEDFQVSGTPPSSSPPPSPPLPPSGPPCPAIQTHLLTHQRTKLVTGVREQWDKFVKLEGVKRIVAFGGWAFSNEPGTNHIIRNGVKPPNRAKFAANIVDFVNANKLDGVDFDWEYPGATDIEGSDPGTPQDGDNYLEFLKVIKSSLGSGKTVSFAAPASYWYLKSFPIKQMAEVVDYIVYMTYDLHGESASTRLQYRLRRDSEV